MIQVSRHASADDDNRIANRALISSAPQDVIDVGSAVRRVNAAGGLAAIADLDSSLKLVAGYLWLAATIDAVNSSRDCVRTASIGQTR